MPEVDWASAVEEYEREGFVVLRNVLDPEVLFLVFCQRPATCRNVRGI